MGVPLGRRITRLAAALACTLGSSDLLLKATLLPRGSGLAVAAATRRALPARMLLLPTRASCRTVQELLPDPDTGLRSHRIQMRPEKASVRKGHGAQVAPLLLCDATALREQSITAQSRNSSQSHGRGGHSRTQPGGRSREHGLKVASRNLPSGQMVLCLLYTSPSPRDGATSRMPSSA